MSVKATYDGVVRLPWSLGMISTRSCIHTPTHLHATAGQLAHRSDADTSGTFKQVLLNSRSSKQLA